MASSLDQDCDKINDIMNNLIYCDILDESFTGFIKSSPDLDLVNRKTLERNIINTFQSISTESIEYVVKFYINRMSTVYNYNQSKLLFDMLEVVVQIDKESNTELINRKNACEQILTSPNFEFQNEVFWVNGLQFIRKILSSMNYKQVRDIFAFLLSKISLIPLKSTTSMCKQINSLYFLIEYIFDRSESLLPAYLVLDEILKKTAVWQNGHWKFSQLISSFVDSFRPIAKAVSVSGRPKILPIAGYSLSINYLKLDSSSAKYKQKGLLPYEKDMSEPQLDLLHFIIEQNNCRDAIVNMLSLNKSKGRNTVLENLLIELINKAIVKTGNFKSLAESENFETFDLSDPENELSPLVFLWQHISSTALYFELIYPNIYFHSFLAELTDAISKYSSQPNTSKILLKSREFFMWSLLNILSGYIQKIPIQNLYPIFKLFDIFYAEKESIPLPDFNKPTCFFIMAAASIWNLISKKVDNDLKFQRPVLIALKKHVDFLNGAIVNNTNSNDFITVILCNSFITNNETYNKTLRSFCDNFLGSRTQQPIIPITLLDSLTVHCKMYLINHITNQFSAMIQTKSVTYAIVETYCRLLAYHELETLVIKSVINQLVPKSFSANSWDLLFIFLEIFSYRVHHVNCALRIQLLRIIYSKQNISKINHVQLYYQIESTTLKVIFYLNSTEFLTLPALIHHKVMTEFLNFLPADSEELNKVFVLTLARAFHITGSETLSSNWVTDVLTHITNNLNTELIWPEFTLKCFPSVISKFFQENAKPRESIKDLLKQTVDEEYQKWKSFQNDGDLIMYFTSPGTPPVFYCLLYKMLLEDKPITLIVYQILDKLGFHSQSIQLRKFADFLVYEFANLDSKQMNKVLDALNELIWKCHIISFERLLLCLALRNFEGNEAQVCFFLIHYICKNNEFQARVNEFVKENSPEHWKQTNWAERQTTLQSKYPDKYYYEFLKDAGNSGNYNTFNVMFGNVCLRVLPVLDIIVHRLIELPSNHVTIAVDTLIDQHACLFKFHDQPVTYIYNTLHYYENILRKRTNLKRKLVLTLINAFKDIRPRNWIFTDTFLNYSQKFSERNVEEEWNVGTDYYKQLMSRLVDTLSGNLKCPFNSIDYRFNEFPNPIWHALYACCIEILALPGEPADISNAIISVVINNHRSFPRQDIELWINATALILTSLPESYSNVVNERIIDILKNPQELADKDLFYMVDFKNSHLFINESEISYIVALSHAYWSHATVGQICSLNLFLKERIKPIIQTEEQFLFVCYLVGPFLPRFLLERTRCVMDIAIELYEMLEIIDKKCPQLKHIDSICDLLYHIKYMFTGDHIKKDIEGPIQNMRQELKHKLRFI